VGKECATRRAKSRKSVYRCIKVSEANVLLKMSQNDRGYSFIHRMVEGEPPMLFDDRQCFQSSATLPRVSFRRIVCQLCAYSSREEKRANSDDVEQ
jgi:hypothetical protein